MLLQRDTSKVNNIGVKSISVLQLFPIHAKNMAPFIGLEES